MNIQAVDQQRVNTNDIIGSGTQGTVFKVRNIHDKKEYACKQEKMDRNNKKESILKKEYDILKQLQYSKLLPLPISYFQSEGMASLIMELFGKNLEELKNQHPQKKFGMRTVSLIAQQLFQTLQKLHSHGYIHRDIKPNNIVVGNNHKIYLIDYGLAKKYENKLPPKTARIIGNVRFASRQAHFGDSSKASDLESACYVLNYLFMGYLPWQRVKEDIIKIEIQRVNSYEKQPQKTPLWSMKQSFKISDYGQCKYQQKLFLEQLFKLSEFVKKGLGSLQQQQWYKYIRQKVDCLMFIGGGFENSCFDWCGKDCKRQSIYDLCPPGIK